jgi:hypothetical protein
MDLLETIETKRFLGREFLVWVWFESELFESQVSAHGVGDFELLFEKQITLESGGQKDKEQSRLKGVNPASTPEAREALRQGKTPTTAALRLRRGEQEFTFLFQADPFSIAGVKLPALLNEKDDEPFYERMSLMEELEAHLEALFADFVLLRSSDAWERLIMPALLRWAHDKDPVDAPSYRRSRAEALAQARGKSGARKKGREPRAALIFEGLARRRRCCFSGADRGLPRMVFVPARYPTHWPPPLDPAPAPARSRRARRQGPALPGRGR